MTHEPIFNICLNCVHFWDNVRRKIPKNIDSVFEAPDGIDRTQLLTGDCKRHPEYVKRHALDYCGEFWGASWMWTEDPGSIDIQWAVDCDKTDGINNVIEYLRRMAE